MESEPKVCRRCGHDICPFCETWCDGFFASGHPEVVTNGDVDGALLCCGSKCLPVPRGEATATAYSCPNCKGPLLLEDLDKPCVHCDEELDPVKLRTLTILDTPPKETHEE